MQKGSIAMTNLIIVAVVLLILGAAAAYIIRAKKTGVKCIGCPSGCNCSGSCGNVIKDIQETVAD